MDSKSTTIELRNLDAFRQNRNLSNNIKAGEWQTNLSQQITLNAGDSLFVKESYIDTEASSSKEIDIEEDIDVHMSCYYYLDNIGFGNESGEIVKINESADLDVEGSSCFAGTKSSSHDVAGYRVITAIQWEHKFATGDVIPFSYAIASTNLAGENTISEPVHVPAFTDGTFMSECYIIYKISDGCQFTKYKGSITDFGNFGVDTPRLPIAGEDPPSDPAIFTEEVAQLAFEPIEGNFTFKIPKNNYDPADLCSLINRAINENKPPTQFQIVRTPFLKNTGTDLENNPCFLNNSIPNQIFEVLYKNGDDSEGGVPADWLYGASTMLLDWNANQGIFTWTYMHTPFYYQASESTGYFLPKESVSIPDPIPVEISRYSGVVFSSLNATLSSDNTKQYDFWTKKLGFVVEQGQPDSITVSKRIIKDDTIDATLFQITDVKTGLTQTANFTGADSLVTKSTSDVKGTFRYAPSAPPIADAQFNTSSNTVAINASISTFAQNLSFAYFLIEIDANYADSFVDTTSENTKIKSVVGRFFERASYTQGSSTGSLMYTHQGAPQILSSFRVRILESNNKTLATNIGKNNTIFLQLVRAEPAPAIEPAPAKK
jgi:hypothetical protein